MSYTDSSITLRDLWREYRSELFFFLVLVSLVVMSHWLSQFIPADYFDKVVTPIQNSFTITVCLVGAWVLFRHADGLRVRKAWAWTLLIWGGADLFFLLQTYLLNIPVLNIGSDALTAFELFVGNFLGWLMLVYPTEALRPGWLTWRRAVLQLLPMTALVALDYLVPFNLTTLIALYPVALFVLVVVHLRAYRLWCEENYSSMANIDVQWLVRYLLMLAVVGGSFLYMFVTSNPARAFTQQWLLFLLFTYSTEQILFRRDPWANFSSVSSEGLPADGDIPSTAEDGMPSADESGHHDAVTLLEQWMTTDKPYRNPDFRLLDLRQVLPMNRTYLSQLIHDEYGCTFYQFVNRYRIDEAKRMLIECPGMKMADIASAAGFASLSVFSRVFSKLTGMSPREWSKMQSLEA